MFDDNNIMPFDIPTANPSCIIKVIGVGGGGGNAVNHMYKEKIHDVAFVVCNTDSKALEHLRFLSSSSLGTKAWEQVTVRKKLARLQKRV